MNEDDRTEDMIVEDERKRRAHRQAADIPNVIISADDPPASSEGYPPGTEWLKVRADDPLLKP